MVAVLKCYKAHEITEHSISTMAEKAHCALQNTMCALQKYCTHFKKYSADFKKHCTHFKKILHTSKNTVRTSKNTVHTSKNTVRTSKNTVHTSKKIIVRAQRKKLFWEFFCEVRVIFFCEVKFARTAEKGHRTGRLKGNFIWARLFKECLV